MRVRAAAESTLKAARKVPVARTLELTEARRTELWQVIAPWLPDFTEGELGQVHLTAEETRQRQGPKLAAQSVVALLFDKGITSKTDQDRAQRGRMLRNWKREARRCSARERDRS